MGTTPTSRVASLTIASGRLHAPIRCQPPVRRAASHRATGIACGRIFLFSCHDYPCGHCPLSVLVFVYAVHKSGHRLEFAIFCPPLRLDPRIDFWGLAAFFTGEIVPQLNAYPGFDRNFAKAMRFRYSVGGLRCETTARSEGTA